MADSINLFPSNEKQALALLYVQKQDTSSLTAEEFYDFYRETYERIRQHCAEGKPKQKSSY